MTTAPGGSRAGAGAAGRVARRAAGVAGFEVMDLVVAAAARDRRGGPPGPVCHLEVGQPSAPPPASVLAAARAALDEPQGYTPAAGRPDLRAAVADRYGRRHGTPVDPDHVLITTGASAGFLLAALAAFDPGDRVAVPVPGYPCWAAVLGQVGVDAVPVRVGDETGFLPTPDLLDATGPLDGLVVASPANPTGATLGPADLDALQGWARATGARLICDEIYHGIVDGPAAPTAAGDGTTVVVQSFSKYFRMTGWRLGWLVLPPELVGPVERLAQHLYLAPPTVAQAAALAALDADDDLLGEVRRYGRTRSVLVDALRRGGIDHIAPAGGGFYVWADVGHHGDSGALCRTWLDELAVAATPGRDFDPDEGHRWVRCSVAGSDAEVATAAERLAGWLVRT